jgi:hypothetical protein
MRSGTRVATWTSLLFTGELSSQFSLCLFCSLHFHLPRYGSWQDIAKFKSFVQTVHQRFGYKIWVTELGVTTASRPSSSQVKNFMINAYNWMDSTGYVDRASWFGESIFPFWVCFVIFGVRDMVYGEMAWRSGCAAVVMMSSLYRSLPFNYFSDVFVCAVGCFIESDPPDNYATGLNGLFNAAFRLSDLGY